MKLCPVCGSATYFNSSLFTNKCVSCNWEDEHELKENILIKRKEKFNSKLSKSLVEKERRSNIEIEFNIFLN